MNFARNPFLLLVTWNPTCTYTMVLGHIDVTFVIEDLVKWLTWKITFSYTLVSNLWIGYLSRPVSRLESIQFQYFEHITLNLPLIIGTTFTPFYEVTICIWPNNKGLIDLLIMLLGQINLPLIIGTITPFYKVTILMNID